MKSLDAIWLVIGLQFSAAAAASTDGECTTRMLAGRWLFATDVGHQMLLPGGDITAIGTMNIDRAGNLNGKFDANSAGLDVSAEQRLFRNGGGRLRLHRDLDLRDEPGYGTY